MCSCSNSSIRGAWRPRIFDSRRHHIRVFVGMKCAAGREPLNRKELIATPNGNLLKPCYEGCLILSRNDLPLHKPAIQHQSVKRAVELGAGLKEGKGATAALLTSPSETAFSCRPRSRS